MDIRKEILKHSSEENKPILLWLFNKYHNFIQWQFVAFCKHERYGNLSYETHRIWHPTDEGVILYNHAMNVLREKRMNNSEDVNRSFKDNLSKFLATDLKSSWIHFMQGEIYVRKNKRVLPGEKSYNIVSCLDLANIVIHEEFRGRGIFKNEVLAVAQELNPYIYLCIENVMGERFQNFFNKKVDGKKWITDKNESFPSFYWCK